MMKNISKIIIALFAIVAISCTQDDVENRPVITPTDAPVLTAPEAGAIYVLTPENATATGERFTWTAANFGGDVEVTYSVQMDVKGGDFSAPQTLGSKKSEYQLAVTVQVMNSAALKLGAIPYEVKEFDIRVIATAGASTTIVSESTTGITITPYSTENPKLWIPGGYQDTSGYGSKWTHSSAPQLESSGYGKTDFEGYVYFTPAQDGTADNQGFLFTPAANWDHKYGQGATEGTLVVDGSTNLSVTPAGYYLVQADTDPEKLSYTLTPTTWGVLGSATAAITGGDGWGSDADMTYDIATRKWSITINLSADEIKFRANNAWALNYGDSGADGSLEKEGSNIKIPSAGNYTITLDLSIPRHYTYTITKN